MAIVEQPCFALIIKMLISVDKASQLAGWHRAGAGFADRFEDRPGTIVEISVGLRAFHYPVKMTRRGGAVLIEFGLRQSNIVVGDCYVALARAALRFRKLRLALVRIYDLLGEDRLRLNSSC